MVPCLAAAISNGGRNPAQARTIAKNMIVVTEESVLDPSPIDRKVIYGMEMSYHTSLTTGDPQILPVSDVTESHAHVPAASAHGNRS